MFAKGKAVPWWCGVDVTEESGLVRRGIICRKAPNGLIVDFGFPGHNEAFVPFARCANHRVLDATQFYRIGDAVEALYQSAPEGPWRWYPAEFLAGSRDRFAFVAISTGETVIEKVIPLNAVRIVDAVKLSGSAVLRHYFEHAFEVPKSGDLGKLTSDLINKFSGNGFLRIWTRETDTVGMKIEEGRLFYSGNFSRPLTAETVERVLRRMSKKYLSSAAVSSVIVADDAVSPAIDQLGLVDAPIMDHLSHDVVTEIFSFLSPIQQVPCRKVDRLWNSLLTSVANTSRVEIDLSTLNDYKLATRLNEMITESTKVLILTGGCSKEEFQIYQPLNTVKMMLKAMNLRIRFIILYEAWVEATDLLDTWYSADVNTLDPSKWRDACGTLILDIVAVVLPFAVGVPVMVKKEVLHVQEGVGVENVLEKWCPELSGPEMEELERMLRSLWACGNGDHRLFLWMLLSKYQPGDERFNSCVWGDPFPITADTVGVPVLASLRKLTVWALTGQKRVTEAGLKM